MLCNISIFTIKSQNIVTTDTYIDNTGFLLVYENIVYENKNYKYKENCGRLIIFSDTISLENLQFNWLLENGALIYKKLDLETLCYVKWNVQHPFMQDGRHYILSVSDSLSREFQNVSELEYCNMKYDKDIAILDLIKEVTIDKVEIKIYKICVSGIVMCVKSGYVDIFFDGKLDTSYIQNKGFAYIFVPFSNCISISD